MSITPIQNKRLPNPRCSSYATDGFAHKPRFLVLCLHFEQRRKYCNMQVIWCTLIRTNNHATSNADRVNSQQSDHVVPLQHY
ncbi:hypothetical protein DPMN_141368 [Dreissena polymorpha]|uniref:Uncharacterized protein n=1 Tax=Dreissena polymorpha TaxID=45954 RepID=A0A9D4GDA8_DREPO|nr:hypothetical protein DPMN_141368 [Dreissena polymorpha]